MRLELENRFSIADFFYISAWIASFFCVPLSETATHLTNLFFQVIPCSVTTFVILLRFIRTPHVGTTQSLCPPCVVIFPILLCEYVALCVWIVFLIITVFFPLECPQHTQSSYSICKGDPRPKYMFTANGPGMFFFNYCALSLARILYGRMPDLRNKQHIQEESDDCIQNVM